MKIKLLTIICMVIISVWSIFSIIGCDNNDNRYWTITLYSNDGKILRQVKIENCCDYYLRDGCIKFYTNRQENLFCGTFTFEYGDPKPYISGKTETINIKKKVEKDE